MTATNMYSNFGGSTLERNLFVALEQLFRYGDADLPRWGQDDYTIVKSLPLMAVSSITDQYIDRLSRDPGREAAENFPGCRLVCMITLVSLILLMPGFNWSSQARGNISAIVVKNCPGVIKF